jgi:hypothetical protein
MTVFKTVALDHYATPPNRNEPYDVRILPDIIKIAKHTTSVLHQ